MPYSLLLTENAERELQGLDPAVARRVSDKLAQLAARSDVIPHEALRGQFRRYYRLRIGAYRAIYVLDQANRQIVVHRIGHRRDIYER